MSVTVDLNGFDDLKRELGQIGHDARKAGRGSVSYAARKFSRKFKAAVPVGTGPTRKSRRLKSGRQVWYDYGRWKGNVKVQEARSGLASTEVSYRVTSGDAFWSWFYEKGTAKQAPHPVLGPLFDGQVTVMIEDMREGMERYLIRREKRLLAAAGVEA